MGEEYKPCGCSARISQNDPRSEIWIAVFGKTEFPITLRLGLYNRSPYFPGMRFLNGDVKALSSEQREKLVKLIMEKFNLPAEEIKKDLAGGVMPIKDENITVSFCPKHSRILMAA